MAPCGPVVSVANKLWAVWEQGGEEAAALSALDTRHRSLDVTLVELGEVQLGRLEPLATGLFVTHAPLTTDAVHLSLTRQPGQARVALTACKIDQNLQVGTLTTTRLAPERLTPGRFAQRSSPDWQRTLQGVNRHLLSVYLVNLSSAFFDFSLLLEKAQG